MADYLQKSGEQDSSVEQTSANKAILQYGEWLALVRRGLEREGFQLEGLGAGTLESLDLPWLYIEGSTVEEAIDLVIEIGAL